MNLSQSALISKKTNAQLPRSRKTPKKTNGWLRRATRAANTQTRPKMPRNQPKPLKATPRPRRTTQTHEDPESCYNGLESMSVASEMMSPFEGLDLDSNIRRKLERAMDESVRKLYRWAGEMVAEEKLSRSQVDLYGGGVRGEGLGGIYGDGSECGSPVIVRRLEDLEQGGLEGLEEREVGVSEKILNTNVGCGTKVIKRRNLTGRRGLSKVKRKAFRKKKRGEENEFLLRSQKIRNRKIGLESTKSKGTSVMKTRKRKMENFKNTKRRKDLSTSKQSKMLKSKSKFLSKSQIIGSKKIKKSSKKLKQSRKKEKNFIEMNKRMRASLFSKRPRKVSSYLDSKTGDLPNRWRLEAEHNYQNPTQKNHAQTRFKLNNVRHYENQTPNTAHQNKEDIYTQDRENHKTQINKISKVARARNLTIQPQSLAFSKMFQQNNPADNHKIEDLCVESTNTRRMLNLGGSLKGSGRKYHFETDWNFSSNHHIKLNQAMIRVDNPFTKEYSPKPRRKPKLMKARVAKDLPKKPNPASYLPKSMNCLSGRIGARQGPLKRWKGVKNIKRKRTANIKRKRTKSQNEGKAWRRNRVKSDLGFMADRIEIRKREGLKVGAKRGKEANSRKVNTLFGEKGRYRKHSCLGEGSDQRGIDVGHLIRRDKGETERLQRANLGDYTKQNLKRKSAKSVNNGRNSGNKTSGKKKTPKFGKIYSRLRNLEIKPTNSHIPNPKSRISKFQLKIDSICSNTSSMISSSNITAKEPETETENEKLTDSETESYYIKQQQILSSIEDDKKFSFSKGHYKIRLSLNNQKKISAKNTTDVHFITLQDQENKRTHSSSLHAALLEYYRKQACEEETVKKSMNNESTGLGGLSSEEEESGLVEPPQESKFKRGEIRDSRQGEQKEDFRKPQSVESELEDETGTENMDSLMANSRLSKYYDTKQSLTQKAGKPRCLKRQDGSRDLTDPSERLIKIRKMLKHINQLPNPNDTLSQNNSYTNATSEKMSKIQIIESGYASEFDNKNEEPSGLFRSKRMEQRSIMSIDNLGHLFYEGASESMREFLVRQGLLDVKLEGGDGGENWQSQKTPWGEAKELWELNEGTEFGRIEEKRMRTSKRAVRDSGGSVGGLGFSEEEGRNLGEDVSAKREGRDEGGLDWFLKPQEIVTDGEDFDELGCYNNCGPGFRRESGHLRRSGSGSENIISEDQNLDRFLGQNIGSKGEESNEMDMVCELSLRQNFEHESLDSDMTYSDCASIREGKTHSIERRLREIENSSPVDMRQESAKQRQERAQSFKKSWEEIEERSKEDNLQLKREKERILRMVKERKRKGDMAGGKIFDTQGGNPGMGHHMTPGQNGVKNKGHMRMHSDQTLEGFMADLTSHKGDRPAAKNKSQPDLLQTLGLAPNFTEPLNHQIQKHIRVKSENSYQQSKSTSYYSLEEVLALKQKASLEKNLAYDVNLNGNKRSIQEISSHIRDYETGREGGIFNAPGSIMKNLRSVGRNLNVEPLEIDWEEELEDMCEGANPFKSGRKEEMVIRSMEPFEDYESEGSQLSGVDQKMEGDFTGEHSRGQLASRAEDFQNPSKFSVYSFNPKPTLRNRNTKLKTEPNLEKQSKTQTQNNFTKPQNPADLKMEEMDLGDTPESSLMESDKPISDSTLEEFENQFADTIKEEPSAEARSETNHSSSEKKGFPNFESNFFVKSRGNGFGRQANGQMSGFGGLEKNSGEEFYSIYEGPRSEKLVEK